MYQEIFFPNSIMILHPASVTHLSWDCHRNDLTCAFSKQPVEPVVKEENGKLEKYTVNLLIFLQITNNR